MFDSKSYIVNIPEKSCENCKYSKYDESFKSLSCPDPDDANDKRRMPIPVHQTGLCDNFKSKVIKKSKSL